MKSKIKLTSFVVFILLFSLCINIKTDVKAHIENVFENDAVLEFISFGDHDIIDQLYTKGQVVQLNHVPIKEGYSFLGWYLDEDFEVKIDSITMDKNQKVYAKWKKSSDFDLPSIEKPSTGTSQVIITSLDKPCENKKDEAEIDYVNVMNRLVLNLYYRYSVYS